VEATAASVVEGFAAGPLRIGQVVSTAVARRAGSDRLDKRSSLWVDGVMVGDAAVTLSREGLAVAGTRAPLPSPAAVTDQLRAAGVRVTYLEAVESDTGVVAAGVDIAVTSAVPGPVSPVTVHYVLGRAAAHATAIAAPPLVGAVPDLTPPAATGAATPPGAPAGPPPPFPVSAPSVSAAPPCGAAAIPNVSAALALGPAATERSAAPPCGPAAAAAAVSGEVASLPPAAPGPPSPAEVAAPAPAVLRPAGVLVPRFAVTGPYTAFVGAAVALAACAALYARQGMAR
jgi:hypothetical protein